jgi:hypothetical protein
MRLANLGLSGEAIAAARHLEFAVDARDPRREIRWREQPAFPPEYQSCEGPFMRKQKTRAAIAFARRQQCIL